MVLAAQTPFGFGAIFAAFALLFGCVSSTSANTVQNAPDLCRAAAQTASDQTGVPLPVLMAITLTETGRTTDAGLQPWPWAINQAGDGHWFSTPDEAVQFAEDQLDLGLRNFDVGCFQVNHRWHSKGFSSTINMFDPAKNALYAARFLADLHDELGDWSLAAGAYHSRTPELATTYRAKFDTILANLNGQPSPGFEQDPAPARVNRFPLLQAGLKSSASSLVPLTSGGVRMFGGQP